MLKTYNHIFLRFYKPVLYWL